MSFQLSSGGGTILVILRGCASVLKTHLSNGNRGLFGSSKIKYKYLRVSAKKKLICAYQKIKSTALNFTNELPFLAIVPCICYHVDSMNTRKPRVRSTKRV